jgi:hypothetical protein
MTNIQNKPESKPRFAKLVRVVGFSLGAAMLMPLGSLASAQDAFIEIDSAPHAYERWPHTVYHGDHAYYGDGRWYVHRGERWGYYRDEPRELGHYRREYYRAPRHHHHHHYHEHVIEVRP